MEVKKLDGDLPGHIFGQRRMSRMNVVIVRELHGIGQSQIGNLRRKNFRSMKDGKRIKEEGEENADCRYGEVEKREEHGNCSVRIR